MTLRITGFSNFVHRPVHQRLRLALSKETNRVGVSLLTLRTETDLVSEKLCFLVFRIPGDRQNPKNSNYENRAILN
jgi:hypothetical protein